MKTIRFDLEQKQNKFKILNAVNGGPWHKRHATDQVISTYKHYKAARIPYCRNHDEAIYSTYGGPFAHDITRMFPNFDADPYNPESYDFACTDEAILACLEAGTETFFRLGQSIEHHIKKHHTLPPKDFKKWAVICEQVIRHYNEGWADGYELNIQYWEIWNEPDLDPDDSTNKRTWGGTKAQFFDMYEIAAKHLKGCFPHLKIGGPSLARDTQWAEDFLQEMQKREVPIDFFSWHIYATEPTRMLNRANILKELLEKYGYGRAESILNEWNYVKDWREHFLYTVEMIHGLKGSAFTLACICEVQKCDALDMLMYYDALPNQFNGMFDIYSAKPFKGYYPIYWYGMFYDMEGEITAVEEPENIYTLCGVDKDGKVLATVTYYSDDDASENCQVKIDFGKQGNYEIYLLDKEHNAELVGTTDNLTFDMEIHSSILIKEI